MANGKKKSPKITPWICTCSVSFPPFVSFLLKSYNPIESLTLHKSIHACRPPIVYTSQLIIQINSIGIRRRIIATSLDIPL
jgi:hypothetical protein